MIGIISPAKNMIPAHREGLCLTKPVYEEESRQLAHTIAQLSPWELQSLMKVNEKLAAQAYMDYQDFEEREKTAALLSYDGLVFKQLDRQSYGEEELQYAQDHLRILSGLYGILKPLDGIRPYRLEMQTPLKLPEGNLYRFWDRKLYEQLTAQDRVIVNLASEEYARTVRKWLLPSDRFIDVEFLVWRKGKLRTLATWAKQARGQMVQFMMEHKVREPEELTAFCWNDYTYRPELSSREKYCFVCG